MLNKFKSTLSQRETKTDENALWGKIQKKEPGHYSVIEKK